MQESGDVRLLMSNETKNSLPKLDRRHKLIALLPSNYLQALDHGDIALMMARFDIASMHVTDPALSDKQPLTNFFVCTIQDTEGML